MWEKDFFFSVRMVIKLCLIRDVILSASLENKSFSVLGKLDWNHGSKTCLNVIVASTVLSGGDRGHLFIKPF